MAETLAKGTEVTVTGRVKLDQWEDKEGNKRSAASLLVDAIGPNLRPNTATVSRIDRSSSAEPAGWAGAQTDEPPF